MTDFNLTNWSMTEFSRRYVDNADVYIVERRRLFEIVQSFYVHFLKGRQNRILDLGCGEGILTGELLKADSSLSAVLLDGSEDMLDKAKKRLKGFNNINFTKASFQELLAKDILDSKFDFVVSSMAIHHLTMPEKESLFRRVHSWLDEGGYFVNIDVLLPPTEALDAWYMKLWEQWMDDMKATLGREGEPSGNIIKRYKDNGDNQPDTLSAQIGALKEIGFRDVDCFYKYGIFSVYGGRK